MMKNVNTKTLILILFLAGFSLSVMAQPGPRQRTMPRQSQQQRGPIIPDLTEEQKDQIKKIMTDQKETAEPLMDEYKINQAKLEAVLNDDAPDMKVVTQLVEANGKLMTEMKISRIESQIAIRNLLTDEQKAAYDLRRNRFDRQRQWADRSPYRRGQNRGRFN